MNTDNFTIESSDIEFAQNICKLIADTDVRNRAVANAMAGRIAAKYFDTETYDIDTDSGLHNIGIVLQDIDISDIYINNAYIDVRVFFNEDEIVIPAEHFDNNLLPAAYMFIKINADLSGAEVIGFKNPETIDKAKLNDGYFKLTEDDMESFYDVEPLLAAYVDDSIEVEDKDIFEYLDNTLDDKNAFYASLLKSKDGRLRLAKAAKAKLIFKYISINKAPVDTNTSNEEQELDFIDDFNIESEELVLSDTLDSSSGSPEPDMIPEDDTSIENFLVDDIEELPIEEDNTDNSDSLQTEESSTDLTEEDLERELDATDEQSEELSDETEEEFSANSAEENDDDVIVDDNIEITEENEIDESSLSEESVQEEIPEYTTVTTPNVLDELSNEDSDVSEVEDSENSELPDGNQEEQINALFHNEDDTIVDEDEVSPGMKVYQNKRKNSAVAPLLILTLLIIAGALGYTGYTKFLSAPPQSEDTSIIPEANKTANMPEPKKETVDAMPIETVEQTEEPEDSNIAVSTSIPAIEQNLDASILVSNLKVDWEVPAGYASNTSAKRYLVKLGKIIQLNLKTELLLLSKPPITNKIAVEITYNRGSRKFEATGITISSGEKSVDDLILQTVNKALAMNLSTNTDSFAKLQGNPVLIIHL